MPKYETTRGQFIDSPIMGFGGDAPVEMPADLPGVYNEQQAKVAALIVSQLHVDAAKVTPDAEFHADLKADSLDMVELTILFEDEMGISISDDEAAAVTTVREAFDLVEAKLRG